MPTPPRPVVRLLPHVVAVRETFGTAPRSWAMHFRNAATADAYAESYRDGEHAVEQSSTHKES